MRLRRLEIVVIGVTLAFVLFLSGYFTGVRTSVNILPVGTQDVPQQMMVPSMVQNTPVPPAEVQAPLPGAQAQETTNTQPASGSVSPAQPQEPAGIPTVSDGRININRASHSELMDLPGIGRVLAERIIEYRNAHGPYMRIEDVRNVSGIGERRFDTIKDKITVG